MSPKRSNSAGDQELAKGLNIPLQMGVWAMKSMGTDGLVALGSGKGGWGDRYRASRTNDVTGLRGVIWFGKCPSFLTCSRFFS